MLAQIEQDRNQFATDYYNAKNTGVISSASWHPLQHSRHQHCEPLKNATKDVLHVGLEWYIEQAITHPGQFSCPKPISSTIYDYTQKLIGICSDHYMTHEDFHKWVLDLATDLTQCKVSAAA
jgi:hypothetical protein